MGSDVVADGNERMGGACRVCNRRDMVVDGDICYRCEIWELRQENFRLKRFLILGVYDRLVDELHLRATRQGVAVENGWLLRPKDGLREGLRLAVFSSREHVCRALGLMHERGLIIKRAGTRRIIVTPKLMEAYATLGEKERVW